MESSGSSLIIIFYLLERRNKSIFNSSLLAGLYLIPSFISFILCWAFKGNIDNALIIHQSWQSLKNILPTLGSLNQSLPSGAIASILFHKFI